MTEPQTEITERKRVEQALKEARTYAENIVATVREPLLVLDEDLRVKSANRSFYETFGVSPEETEKHLVYELGDHQWDIPRLRELLEEVLPKNKVFDDFEVDHEFPTIGHKTMLLNARQLRRDGTDSGMILLAIEDVTERRRLIEDITEHKRLEQALRESEQSLQQRVAELDAFTYSVSHDLKEPLRAIEAFSRFLLEDYRDRLDEQGREYLAKLATASVRMQRLIEDLLALSRVSRQLSAPFPVDLRRLVKETVQAMRPTIDAKGATVTVEDGLPDVLANPPRMEQLFANLIGNALKFNKSNQPLVKVGMRGVEDGMTTLYVQDNGIGIDPQYHERIFGIFQRLHHREDYEGTGAGLAIVKRVVEGLGGRIWVESEVDAGATFFFTLPLWRGRATSIRSETA
jgi:two-component system CheB/CheR fusion protein